ncbi:hypothetical protein CU633_05585 [Bacillus sp. V3-13]|uniref:DUF4003 family protein n=1 Tax=Bacillus sp. V3-13 TaxID=2053728 RepID=UPI000C7933DA|nr:DUF4003 family protein [Bacillus sp. V3-13]PLR78448.1 hypothetical protein CU633_05585 [Bacillus sp. V3-13]
MLSTSLRRKLDLYSSIYSELKDHLKWKVSDNRTLMMVSSMYILNGQSFDLRRFIDLSNYIKDRVGVFSTLKSSQRYTIAAAFAVRYEQPEEKFDEYLKLYEQMVRSGFSRGAFTYIAALPMLENDVKGDSYQEKIVKSLAIYKGMRSKHLFLTTNSDYPLAVLLADVDGSIDELMDAIDIYYTNLAAGGFKKGNDLQFLSHILSLNDEKDSELLIQRCFTLLDSFQKWGIKLKPMHYPAIGLLSFVENSSNDLTLIKQITNELNANKHFKWHKDMNLTMAVNFVMSEKIENSSLLNTGLYTTMEALIQAQQAAMYAAIVGASVAITGSGDA